GRVPRRGRPGGRDPRRLRHAGRDQAARPRGRARRAVGRRGRDGGRLPGDGTAGDRRVAARTTVRYDVLRSGPPWRRALTVRLTAARPLRLARLSLVLRPGRVMPHRPADGEVLGAWEQVPVPGELSLA